ncbi:hypothetical protein EMCRGX_G009361 [Ephydatia muelleri]
MSTTNAHSCKTRWVSPEDVFNLPLYEHHLVIDIRQNEEYLRGHIVSAVSYPSPSRECTEKERETTLFDFVRSYVEQYARPENPNPVVIYGDDRLETQSHAEWLSTKLCTLKNDRKRIVAYDRSRSDEEHGYDGFEFFCETLADATNEIWVLDGGYEGFQSQYGFLCGNVEFTDLHPLPHQINRYLFLGSRVVPLNASCLSQLGITHVIVSDRQEIEWEEFGGIQVLRCAVRDVDSERMAPCWTSCVEFIEGARRSGGRVMVMLHGRSRSASVVMAYLVRTTAGLSVELAWELLTSKCWHLIDRALVYYDQLKVWSEEEVGLSSARAIADQKGTGDHLETGVATTTTTGCV